MSHLTSHLYLNVHLNVLRHLNIIEERTLLHFIRDHIEEKKTLTLIFKQFNSLKKKTYISQTICQCQTETLKPPVSIK